METKSLLVQKVDNCSELFGFPDFIMNVTELDKGYKELEISEKEFFENQVSDINQAYEEPVHSIKLF